MNAGDTFLVPSRNDHLWMVISDPAKNPELVVVCFLSWQNHYDQACIVEAGEHSFVKHSTCVHYPGAEHVHNSKLEELKKAGKLRPKDPLSPGLLDRIRKSAENSDIPLDCYRILRDQGFVP